MTFWFLTVSNLLILFLVRNNKICTLDLNDRYIDSLATT